MFKKVKRILPIVLSLVMVLGCSLTVSAAETDVPELDTTMIATIKPIVEDLISEAKDEGLPTKYIFVRMDEDKYFTLYVSDLPMFSTASYSSRTFDDNVWHMSSAIYTQGGFYMAAYAIDGYDSNEEHKFYYKSVPLEHCYNCPYYASNHDIFLSDGNLFIAADTSGFFPHPPIAELAETLPGIVTQGAKTITITAVSCLALLVGCLTLPKLSRKFLY